MNPPLTYVQKIITFGAYAMFAATLFACGKDNMSVEGVADQDAPVAREFLRKNKAGIQQ